MALQRSIAVPRLRQQQVGAVVAPEVGLRTAGAGARVVGSSGSVGTDGQCSSTERQDQRHDLRPRVAEVGIVWSM
jgi:hypothetical protein